MRTHFWTSFWSSESDDEYYSLLKYIRFEFMDSDHALAFMDAIYPSRIDSVLWESLTRFVLSSLKTKSVRDEVFEYDSSSPMKGIFSHLREKCGGNPHLKGVIEVTASSTSWNQCYNALDYGWDNSWYTSDVPNSWIQSSFPCELHNQDI